MKIFRILILPFVVVVAVAGRHAAGLAAETADPNATNPLTIDPDLAIFTGVIFLLSAGRALRAWPGNR